MCVLGGEREREKGRERESESDSLETISVVEQCVIMVVTCTVKLTLRTVLAFLWP